MQGSEAKRLLDEVKRELAPHDPLHLCAQISYGGRGGVKPPGRGRHGRHTPTSTFPKTASWPHNIAHFARALRKAGLPIGPGRMLDAIRAVEAAGFTGARISTTRCTPVFVSRPEQRAVFAQVFRLFWRDPRYLEHMMSLLLPAGARRAGRPRRRGRRKARGRGAAGRRSCRRRPKPTTPRPRRDRDRRHRHHVGRRTAEDARLRTDVARPRSPRPSGCWRGWRCRCNPLITRRDAPPMHWAARIDCARTLRAGAAPGRRDRAVWPAKRPVTRWPNLVVLCDISGSMAEYSPHGAAFRPCGRQPQGAGLGAGACLHLRHAADQHHPPPARPRCRCRPEGRRGRGAGLVRRHPHRRLPARLQPRLVAPGAGAGGGGPADHRRAGPRRCRRCWRARWSGCTCPAAG